MVAVLAIAILLTFHCAPAEGRKVIFGFLVSLFSFWFLRPHSKVKSNQSKFEDILQCCWNALIWPLIKMNLVWNIDVLNRGEPFLAQYAPPPPPRSLIHQNRLGQIGLDDMFSKNNSWPLILIWLIPYLYTPCLASSFILNSYVKSRK